jgi:restriction endonuclease
MQGNNQNVLSIFNDHFVEFISDVQSVFPENVDVLTAKNSLVMIRKANPKMIIKIWKTIHTKNEIQYKFDSFCSICICRINVFRMWLFKSKSLS